MDFLLFCRYSLDLVLLILVIYYLYALFKSTSSLTILRGFFIVTAFGILVYVLHLEALKWIFTNIVRNLPILIVVLFQSEIRRILVKVGEAWKVNTGNNTTVSEELTKAVSYMSHRRIGALIILEAKVGLRDIMEHASKIRADISAELLISIFWKDSLLHDGAVVIQNNKIVAARVIIPSILLSQAENKRNLGTRHRAALALAKETDAICIIVSEETGKISIAYNDNLEYGLSLDAFTSRVNEILASL